VALFTHVTVGANDLARARAFYDRVQRTLGCKRLTDPWVIPDHDQLCRARSGGSCGVSSRSSYVGAKDAGAVGPRDWAPHAYAPYAGDHDGNKIAAYCFKAN
jgi:catechol 2,3-dioxygenase-like lactoylglutathione lyase family enzyme